MVALRNASLHINNKMVSYIPVYILKIIRWRQNLSTDRHETFRDVSANSTSLSLDIFANLFYILGVFNTKILVDIIDGAIFSTVHVRARSLTEKAAIV